ncbi:MAG: AsmA-like C-terminal region-containing protein [Spirosomataceae bacterium]
MPKIIRYSLYTVGIIFILLVALGGWAYQYRDQLFKYLVAQINDNINGHFTAENFHFTPFSNGIGFSFTLYNVHLQDSAYARHRRELLFLQRLTVQVDARQLLKKQFQVRSVCFKNGKINLFTEANGYSNLSVFGKKNTSSAKKEVDSTFKQRFLGRLREVCADNVEFSLQDSLRHKNIAFTMNELTNHVQLKDTLWELNLKGSVYFEGLTFHTKRGAFLEKKPTELDLYMVFNPKNSQLSVDPSLVQVNEDRFGMKGKVAFVGNGRLQLEITTDTIAALRALTIIPKRLAQRIAKFEIWPVVTATVRLDGPLRGGDNPRVIIDFQTKSFQYNSPIGLLSELIATAHFTNQSDTSQAPDDRNSRISVPKVQGLLYGAIPMHTCFTIADLEDPQVVMEGNFNANLAHCNSLFDENKVQLRSGRLLVNYSYNGKMAPIFDDTTNRLNGKLLGKATLVNGAFSYLPQRINFTRMNSIIRFNEKEVEIPFLHLNHQKNKIRISGKISGLLPYAFNSSDKVIGDMSIYTPDLGLDWVRTYHTPPKKRSKKQLTDIIDKIFARLELKTLLIADKVHYRKFQAENVKGRLYFSEQSLKCENVKMQAFGGDFQVTGGLENFDRPVHRLYAAGRVNNADVQKVFYAFDNFGQTTISDHNLSGSLSTTFSYSSQLKSDFSLLPATMNGQLSLEISDGELNHFEPLKRIQRLFFKRRDFDNVRFENLKNRFVLQGQELNMSQMKVASSVLTFFVGGTYSFRDKTDLLVQIPLSNLKRNPDETELQSLDGSNFLIRAVDENGEMKLKYDLDWRKKKR